jgi:hypothetical protein
MQHLSATIVEEIDRLVSLGKPDREIATLYATTVEVVRNIRLGRDGRKKAVSLVILTKDDAPPSDLARDKHIADAKEIGS